jgi:hypothetical protein
MNSETKQAIKAGIAWGIIIAAYALIGALGAIELMRMYS